jgi:hypothetical protein
LDTDKSNGTDFSETDYDALLLDIGENSGVGDTAFVIDSNFL